jgi:hypothetical protein
MIPCMNNGLSIRERYGYPEQSLSQVLTSINATVTHSRISNRVHTVSKPHRPGFTRTDPHRNPC